MKKFIQVSLTVLSLVVLSVAGYIAWGFAHPLIPRDVRNKLDFTALTPVGSPDGFAADSSTVKFDSDSKVLSFILKKPGNQVTLAEQAYPEILIFDKLTGPMNPYSEIQTKSGKVVLTRPKAAGNAQTAVLNSNSQVLLFAKSDKDLTDDEWKQIFNSLDTVK